MAKGIVKFFNEAKGWGFIECDGKSYFIYHKDIIQNTGFRTLKEGQEVLFDASYNERGLKAINLVKVN